MLDEFNHIDKIEIPFKTNVNRAKEKSGVSSESIKKPNVTTESNRNARLVSIIIEDSQKIKSNEEVKYLKYTTIYQDLCSSIYISIDDEIFDDIEETLKQVKNNENLISKVITNQKLNTTDKCKLDTLMTILSIICEWSDRNIQNAINIINNEEIMKVLSYLFKIFLKNTTKYSICEQLLESIVIIFVNLSKRLSIIPQSIISNMTKSLQNKDLNDVIRTAMVLTIAYQCGDQFQNNDDIREILEDKMKKALLNDSQEWCGFSSKELADGLKMLATD